MNTTTKIGKVEVSHCVMCGAALVGRRSGTKTCNSTCRKRLARAKQKIVRHADYAIYHTNLIVEYLTATEFVCIAQQELAEILKHVTAAARRAGVQVVR